MPGLRLLLGCHSVPFNGPAPSTIGRSPGVLPIEGGPISTVHRFGGSAQACLPRLPGVTPERLENPHPVGGRDAPALTGYFRAAARARRHAP